MTPTVRNVPPSVVDPRGKTRFRLHYFMAKIEAQAVDAHTFALLLDTDGYVTEGTGANFFVAKDGVLYTAMTRNGVVFDRAIATAPHTLPPIVSMIMSQTTATHGVVNCERFAAWQDGRAWANVRTPLHTLADNGFLIDGELVTRWKPLGFTTETPSDQIGAFFERRRARPWFFYAEPYPTHLPYDPPEECLRLFLPADYRPEADTPERMRVVRGCLIVHPSGCISKLEAGEKDPLPDDQSDSAHKRTVLWRMVSRVVDGRPNSWIR